MLFIWDAFKMLWIGPISLVLLVRVRIHETIVRRRERLQDGSSDAPPDLTAAA